MNADDPRRGDVAELAWLLPAPAERELPAGRQHTLMEHLISELRLAASPAVGRPATRRRMPVIALAATGAAALAAVIVLAFLPATTPGASPAAVRLLAKIATAATGQPAPQVRNSQFWYIKSWVAYQGCKQVLGNNGVLGKPYDCVMEKPHERQIWQSVSNLCVTGLLREHGQNIPLADAGNRQHCPDRGGVNDPTYRFLQSLPTDPHALLSLIEAQMSATAGGSLHHHRRPAARGDRTASGQRRALPRGRSDPWRHRGRGRDRRDRPPRRRRGHDHRGRAK